MHRLLANQRGIAAIFIIVLVVLGVIVVGIVVSGLVILSNDVVIKVDNRSCGTLDIAKGSAAAGFNFLPGINVPSKIEEGDTAAVQLPDAFVGSVTVGSESVEVNASGRSMTFDTSGSDLDMQQSTWDGQPLADLVGQKVKVSGKHTLVLECK